MKVIATFTTADGRAYSVETTRSKGSGAARGKTHHQTEIARF